MIDLSFLTEEEQEAILEVLQRDADLKRAEEERVRHLPEKVKDDTQIKNMSGQWFYEAKSKRHREKIHGADIIRASMRRKPLTAELNQRKAGKTKNSWVNNVNQEVLTQPMEETEGELKPSQSNISNTLEKPQEDASKLDISPSKQRKNPFNDSVISEENTKSGQRENGIASLSESREKDSLSPSVENQPRVTLTNHNRVEESEQAPVGPNELQRQAGKPVPKARKNVHKTSDVSLKSEDSFSKAPGKIKQVDSHGTPPRGILKRSPSSSSTDSEVLRLNQNSDQLTKSGLPTSTILEDAAEKNSPPAGEAEELSQNSLERLKQVRFSSSVSRKGHQLDLELQESKESGEFKLLDSDYVQSRDNHVGGSDVLQNGQSWPTKPPRAHSPALDGNTEDRGVSQEGKVAPSLCHPNSTTDLPSDTLQPMKGTFLDPLPPNESPGKISHLVGEEQIAETQPPSKAKELSPEPEAASKSTTGQELSLAKIEDPQAPKAGSADLEQGKPALVEGQRAKTASAPDKRAAEALKAADESISKVLDWFKRTSNTAGKEETDMPKVRELAVTREDNELSTYGLNLDSPAHEREEPTNKEYLFREQQEQPSFTKTVDQNLNKTGETAVEANNERDGENSSVGEHKAFEDKNIHPGLKTMDSSLGKVMKRAHSIQAYTDGEQDVKLFLEEGSFESQPGEPVEEEPKGKQSESEENMQLANQGNRNLQQQEIKQSSPDNKKSVKDIRAFWEREETRKLGSKGDLLNKSTSASNTVLNSKKEPHSVKPEGGSSGYVTAESDNEQGKYNLVTFKRVLLTEDESEPDKDDIKLSSGMTAPRLIDESKQSHPMDRSGKIFPSNQESTEFSELPGGENFHPRPSTVSFSKEGGSLQPVVLEKEKTAPTLQQKSQFKIHSLKEKLDEDSKAQMLNPSQFQSLRSFWDVGAKPQSRTDEGKAAVTVPKSRNSDAEDYLEKSEELKEAAKGMRQVVLGDEQQKQIIQEEKVEEPNANISSLNLLETSRVISKEAGQPMPSLSVDTFPKGSLQFVLPKDSYLEGGTVLPVEEHVEKTEVLSQLSSFDRGLQKLLLEASQESLPVYPATDEKGVPSLGLSAEVQMPSDDQIQQCKMDPAARKGEITSSEVVEAVNRTLVPSKVDTMAHDPRLEKLLKEASDVKTSPKQPIVVAVVEQVISPSEQKRFFHKVMERSHYLDPSSQQKDSMSPVETEIAMTKHTTSRDHDDDPKASKQNVFRSTEESNSVPQRAPDMEESHGYLNDPTSPEGVLQVPSVKLVPLNSHLATQNKANSPTKEVSETVTKVNVPSKNKYSDMNARLACLLNEPSTTPYILTTTENDPKTQFEGTPRETQERSFFSSQTIPASPQVASSSRETVSKITKRGADEDGGSILATMEDETGEEAAVVSPFKYHENLRAGEHSVSGGEQLKDVAETVVKAFKPNSYEPAALKASLHKLLDEDSEITEVTKPTHVLLQTDQNVNSVFYKVAPHRQEIIETIEKTNVSSRQAELKASFQKLLQEESEVPPSKEESRVSSNGIPVESRSNQNVNLSDQQKISQEISEIVSRTVVPSKEKQKDFNSGLQKLLEESVLTQSSQLTSLNGPESMKDFPQEANETIIKSTAPAKDDAVFKSNLGKLIRESSGASLQKSMEDNPEAAADSTPQLKKQSSSVKMLPSAPSPLSDFRTEIKIPLKGKAFKQDNQTIEGVPKTITVFQKTVQVNISSTKVAHQEEGEDKREKHYAREGEAEVTVASLNNANEVVDVLPGFQRTSTPNTEKESPLRVSKVELKFGTKKADEKNNEEEEEEEDAKSFGSDLSDELNRSFAEIQRSRTRSEDESNPVMEALKRSSNRQIPSKSLEDIPSAISNKGKINLPKEDYMLSAEDDQKTEHPDELNENVQGISTAPTFPVNQFSRPEKVKQMSKSVPTFVQEESDDRETDTASDSSYPLGRIKKSPSSLTNLSGSSGLASLSSVSTSVMSVYSGDFGNIDVKGNIQFAIDYVEQLKELHIFIAQGKDLAIGDVKKQRSDPYVKSYLLPEKYKLGKRKTSVKKKTLNPVFNEILRYKVDKELLATQRLNISVWHNDIFGRNSFLGEVELDLGNWDWNDKQNKQMIWYPLKPRTLLTSLEAENRGDIKIALQYVPQPAGGKKTSATGEVHIWVKECKDLPILRGNRINSFVKCTVLPDTSRKSRQKTRAIAKTTNPAFNHTMVYDGFKPEDLKEACVELTVWDHNKLANHFLGGLRIGFGTGKSYGTPVDWMDSTLDEICLWERMINSPNEWVEDTLPLRMLTVIKMAK